MTKLIAILLSVACVLSIVIPAFATEAEDTRTTVVSLELDPSLEHYTLSIPAEIKLDMTKDENLIPVTLTDVALCWNRNLNVYVTAKNASEEAYETEVNDSEFVGSSYLINTEDPTKKILYGIIDPQGNQYERGGHAAYAWLNVDGSISIHDGDLRIKVLGEYPGAGTYTDTLTFTVKLSR